MFNLKNINLLTSFAVFSLITMLTACSNSDDDPVSVLPVFDPAAAPQNVQVVSGDDDTTDVWNTISWTPVSAATDYVVYVSNTPGVTESSTVVDPIADTLNNDGFKNSVTHSGLNEVVAGNTYYYVVQAVSGSESSILSAEVTGTPQQSETDKALNDVAWNGTTLVAVGASGAILSSANGMADAWTDDSVVTDNSLTGVTWGNSQFVIVGAGSTVLTGDGTTIWNTEDLSGITPAQSLEDVTWLGDRYIAVGQNGGIITSDANGSVWTVLNPGIDVSAITLKGVAGNEGGNGNGDIIVVVGTNGTMLTSIDDGVNWQELPQDVNNDLNDISWDGSQFGVVGSNDTILTSTDGVTWAPRIPGTSNITLVAASQWDSSLPVNPILGAVGSAGTYVVSQDATTGFDVPTGTTEQLSGMTWVDNGVTPAYFVMVGNDGTVLTSQLQ